MGRGCFFPNGVNSPAAQDSLVMKCWQHLTTNDHDPARNKMQPTARATPWVSLSRSHRNMRMGRQVLKGSASVRSRRALS